MVVGAAGQPWTESEIEEVLDAYFEMLVWQLDGTSFVKAEVRSEVESKLPARAKKSIELKWCNVSAVLEEHGLPRVEGYKPLPHYQALLADSVDAWLKHHRATARAISLS